MVEMYNKIPTNKAHTISTDCVMAKRKQSSVSRRHWCRCCCCCGRRRYRLYYCYGMGIFISWNSMLFNNHVDDFGTHRKGISRVPYTVKLLCVRVWTLSLIRISLRYNLPFKMNYPIPLIKMNSFFLSLSFCLPLAHYFLHHFFSFYIYLIHWIGEPFC